jgi:tyrosinase
MPHLIQYCERILFCVALFTPPLTIMKSWLHHANVDRIIAIYQAMNPSSFLTPLEDYDGTFTIAPDSTDTLTTPLEPFSINTQGTFWTSAKSQNLSAFGYTYPEIQDWNQNATELASNVTAQVYNLYYTPPSAASSSRRSTEGRTKFIEWSARISVSKYEFNGKPFFVRLFLTGVPENPKDWATSSACIGSLVLLPGTQQSIGLQPKPLSYDEISLMKGLSAVGNDGQDVRAVVDYLTDHLEWRVQLVGCLSMMLSC